MLLKLLTHSDRNRFTPSVWCLTDEGPVAEKIRALGIPVSSVEMQRGVPDMGGVLRLSGQLRQFHPDIVQTWLYHADVAGGIAARMAGARRLVWNIRNSAFDPAYAKKSTLTMARIAAPLSHVLPDAILCCSETARNEHVRLGYTASKFTVLPNGFDIATLRPDTTARESVLAELKLPSDALTVGMVARYDPQKDHRTFFAAAAKVRSVIGNAYFICCGDGVTFENEKLYKKAGEAGIGSALRLLGRRTDMARLNASFDIAVSSSRYGEGFPNVIGEAMACGTPCVVTETGDSPYVVGDTGRVVRPADSEGLAQAMIELLTLTDLQRRELGGRARQRVIDNFDIQDVVGKYGLFYERLLARRPVPSPKEGR